MRYLKATALLALAPLASAHVAAWTKGMYCVVSETIATTGANGATDTISRTEPTRVSRI